MLSVIHASTATLAQSSISSNTRVSYVYWLEGGYRGYLATKRTNGKPTHPHSDDNKYKSNLVMIYWLLRYSRLSLLHRDSYESLLQFWHGNKSVPRLE